MSRKDYTTSSNHGKNKTRADEKSNIRGSVYKYRTPKRQYTKATQDAKAAFLMQSGYNSQRSNYDIVKPINQAKSEIKGNSSYGRGYGKGPAVEHVDSFDSRKKSLGYQAVGDGSVNGTKNNTSVATPKGRMVTSEKGSSKKSGYSPMDTSDSSATLWGKSDRYRDGVGSKHIKSARKSSKQKFKNKKKQSVNGGSTGKRNFNEQNVAQPLRKRDIAYGIAGTAASAGAVGAGLYGGYRAAKYLARKLKKKKKEENGGNES